MFSLVFLQNHLTSLVLPAFIIISALFSLFLFWRAGRHELFESEVLFDSIFLGLLGALIFSRVFDFITRPDIYAWSIKKLIFFNVYGGFNFYGALAGLILAQTFLFKNKKLSIWFIFDLMVAPLALTQSLVFLGLFFAKKSEVLKLTVDFKILKVLNINLSVSLIYFFAYFILFFTLMRLSQKKRHLGFFSCFYLVSIAILGLPLSFGAAPKLFNLFSPQLILNFLVLIAASVFWYSLLKRKPIKDIKSFFGFLLLLILATRRITTRVNDAGKLSKNILFFPYFLVRSILALLAILGKEIAFGLSDFISAFKTKR